VTNWTVAANVANGRHAGLPVQGCDGRLPSSPGPFQIDREASAGTFQNEFADAVLDGALFAFGNPAVRPRVVRR
jgi:hypothetical protein